MLVELIHIQPVETTGPVASTQTDLIALNF
jgi:hypothetical protein